MYQITRSSESEEITHLPDGSILCTYTVMVALKEVPDISFEPLELLLRTPSTIRGDGFTWFRT